jgi:hypothetical protein
LLLLAAVKISFLAVCQFPEFFNSISRLRKKINMNINRKNMNMDINMNKNSMPKKKWLLLTNFVVSSSSMPIVKIKCLPALGILLDN